MEKYEVTKSRDTDLLRANLNRKHCCICFFGTRIEYFALKGACLRVWNVTKKINFVSSAREKYDFVSYVPSQKLMNKL
jgi:hypothetical protein